MIQLQLESPRIPNQPQLSITKAWQETDFTRCGWNSDEQ